MNRNTLSKLRYYRPFLGQAQDAIVAARMMIELCSEDPWERMSDHLSLGRLLVGVGEIENAWNALKVVLDWPEFKECFCLGKARSAVELAFDISAAARIEHDLSVKAFDTAVRLIDEGCSTSYVILKKAQDCSERLDRGRLFERFQIAAEKERDKIQHQLDGR